jgi:hypothetical protein
MALGAPLSFVGQIGAVQTQIVDQYVSVEDEGGRRVVTIVLIIHTFGKVSWGDDCEQPADSLDYQTIQSRQWSRPNAGRG